MAKKTNFEHAYELKQGGIKNLTDFPLDHTAMRVPETERMAAVRAQIEALQEQYSTLKEAEQLRYWKTFLYIAKEGPI